MKKSKVIFTFLLSAVLMLITAISVSAAYLGDADLDYVLTASDARFALRASVNLEKLSPEEFLSADVDVNGKVEASDARKILRASVGLEKMYEYYFCSKMTTENPDEISTIFYRADGQIEKESYKIKKTEGTFLTVYEYDSKNRLTKISGDHGYSVNFIITETTDGYVSKSEDGGSVNMSVFYDKNCIRTGTDNYTTGISEVLDANGRVIKRTFFEKGAADAKSAVINKVVSMNYFENETIPYKILTEYFENGNRTSAESMEYSVGTDKIPTYIGFYVDDWLEAYWNRVQVGTGTYAFLKYDFEDNLHKEFVNVYVYDENGNPSKDMSYHLEDDGKHYMDQTITYEYTLCK